MLRERGCISIQAVSVIRQLAITMSWGGEVIVLVKRHNLALHYIQGYYDMVLVCL